MSELKSNPSHRTLLRLKLSRQCRRGFSFVECMFAIVILGIGSIMIAGVFPVTAQMQQATCDESAATAIAHNARSYLETVMTQANTPSTDGGLRSISDVAPLWSDIKGNLISPSDSRYAWTALYQRGGDNIAEVFVIVLRCRTHEVYRPQLDLVQDTEDLGAHPPTLAARTVGFTMSGTADTPVLQFQSDLSNNAAAVGPGTILITSTVGQMTRHILRIGDAEDESQGRWHLSPECQDEVKSADFAGTNTGFLVGRGYLDPSKTSLGYDGPAQDIAAFVCFVPLR